jgi:diguanylate cyclase (GGDEF)-like protein
MGGMTIAGMDFGRDLPITVRKQRTRDATTMDPTNATLLLVDDDAMNRDMLSRRLERKGYTVLTADGGARALEMVGKHRIDAVLLDVMMPGMSGIETLRRLRLSHSVTELPVIMVTAKDRSEDVVDALDLGANDYVTKPLDFPIVLARIRTQVTTRRADPLTGLPNRVLFMDRLQRLINRVATPDRAPFAVFFLDVDRFKLVNDSLGHMAGDELLISIAQRLETSLRSTDTVARFAGEHTLARLGGDEFTVLLDGVRAVGDAQSVAERLLQVMAQPFALQGREIVTSVSVGIVMSAPRYTQAEDMVRDADTAMYRAKALGKARCEIFDTSMLEAVEQRLQLETDLRRAIDRQELRVFYQPIVTLQGGELCGFEALLRWMHPTRGVIAPDDFIPVAEETGLIVPIGMWVLREACSQMRKWDHEFPDCIKLKINVNLSARQCMQPDLVSDVRGVLEETGLAAERLKLEITEGVVLENSEAVIEIFENLRALGVQLGLDDFGMGYSALSYLRKFPFQTLKIDRSFVDGMQADGGNAEIIRAIVSLAGGLAMDVTAEGVETAEQLSQLKDLACEFGQGFYFYRPLPERDAHAVLKERKWALTSQPMA